MNALDLLQRDQGKLKDIVNSLNASLRNDTHSRQTLVQQLKEEFKQHEQLAEELLYSVLLEHRDTHDLAKHGYRVHRQVDKSILALESLESHRDEWKTQLVELQANLFQHIDQEQKQLFPKARKLLGKRMLDEIGMEMAAQKDHIMI